LGLKPGQIHPGLQRFSLDWGTAPNLETLVIKHLQIKLDDAAAKTAVSPERFFLAIDPLYLRSGGV